jgi:hypothetical protein
MIIQKIEQYLSRNEWTIEKVILGLLAIWSKKFDGKLFKVLVPLDEELGDFNAKMFELFDLLSRAENRTKNQIVDSIMATPLVPPNRRNPLTEAVA